MRIAQVSPLYESVPPSAYGGTERVVHYLTEELVQMGHEVSLYASGDSKTSARLVAPCPHSLRMDPDCKDPIAMHISMIDMVSADREQYDVIHFHVDYLHYLVARHLRLPHLTTLHGRQDYPELQAVYARFNDMPVVSISDAQRAPLPQANWIGTVHHGLPRELLRFQPTPSNHFAFVGRVSREKRVDRAVEIAVASGTKLKIAAKIDKADADYYAHEIAPLFEHPLVDYVGEISEDQKSDFIGSARALLFPIDWPEPFGLVMIEAMACGTPVIAFNRGSVAEVIEDGVSGFIVENMSEAIEAAREVGRLHRARVRQAFERRFTARRMAEDYVRLYEGIAQGRERLASRDGVEAALDTPRVAERAYRPLAAMRARRHDHGKNTPFTRSSE